MKYDTLMPEDIEPYLDGRSWKDLNVGDEIAFPEPDGSTPTGESLVGITLTYENWKGEQESTFTSFDAKTGMHTFEDDDGDPVSIHLQDLPARFKRIKFEGSDAYFASGLMLGMCTIGALAQLQLPVGMKDLHLFDTEVTGDITQINLPVGMQSVNFRCTGLTGDLAQLQLPVGMKEVDLSGTEMTGTLPASE